jgi:hypothetical protein
MEEATMHRKFGRNMLISLLGSLVVAGTAFGASFDFVGPWTILVDTESTINGGTVTSSYELGNTPLLHSTHSGAFARGTGEMSRASYSFAASRPFLTDNCSSSACSLDIGKTLYLTSFAADLTGMLTTSGLGDEAFVLYGAEISNLPFARRVGINAFSHQVTDGADLIVDDHYESPEMGQLIGADGQPRTYLLTIGFQILSRSTLPTGFAFADFLNTGGFQVITRASGSPVDSDGDGIPDEEDNCPNTPNADQADTDGDGSGDECDTCPADPLNDGDGDGVCGNIDNCPNVFNPGQEDTDGDGTGDACNDADDPDGDEFITARDNCPAIFNPDQVDEDEDGFGDVCDVCPADPLNDADGDGICGDIDNCPGISNPNQTNIDGDDKGDECDDDDDGDGFLDTADNCPLIPNDQRDNDRDGDGDICDTDNDNDNVLDANDQCLSTEAGATVNADGCSIADLCPCANDWKNRGAYVSCVAQTAETFVAAGLITEAQKDAIVSEAAQSNCGSKK